MSLYVDLDQSSLPSIPSRHQDDDGCLPLTAIVVVALLCNTRTGLPLAVADGTVGIKFLLTVNDTWDPNGCIATVATPVLISGRKYNQSDAVQVGSCDHGPLEFVVLNGSYDGKSQMTLLPLPVPYPGTAPT
ncbi:uncharacterized protein LOC112559223 isoform X2 [Pomacea canaliculata]|uniref:uncharacterized protein LOC112559223 isoform X2 n=1 Tax=Pomacea canaliculata TaxID=400727 RepID=UPI000D7380E1|nr:uncharacterized protein LOC112559223 isoform X2 [Pomacea canaliculata]